MEFKVGDRVIYKDKIGTIIIDKGKMFSWYYYGVKFDEPNDEFHDLDGRCEIHHGYWCLPKELTLVEKFTKEDLCTGDKVTLRNGDELICFKDEDEFIDLDVEKNNNFLFGISDLTTDLRYKDNKNYDIVKIERPVYKTIYQRTEEVKEMTVEEISDALGYEVKIVKGGKDER